ncbi:MAG TPA: hypothetical protein VEC16_03820 [Alphaproteobacteria bacterium]|nr:hypothetical protein [Alphaproteobacteria bacterium]
MQNKSPLEKGIEQLKIYDRIKENVLIVAAGTILTMYSFELIAKFYKPSDKFIQKKESAITSQKKNYEVNSLNSNSNHWKEWYNSMKGY